LTTCLGLQRGERLVVVTDTGREAIGHRFFQAGRDLGAEAVLVTMPNWRPTGRSRLLRWRRPWPPPRWWWRPPPGR